MVQAEKFETLKSQGFELRATSVKELRANRTSCLMPLTQSRADAPGAAIGVMVPNGTASPDNRLSGALEA